MTSTRMITQPERSGFNPPNPAAYSSNFQGPGQPGPGESAPPGGFYIGRYEVIREIGRGGMGEVYLGRDPFIGREVAIKLSASPPSADPESGQRFQQSFFHEARAAGKLEHPNIVTVFDALVQGDQSCLIMEYIDGKTLKDYCRADALLPIANIIKIIFKCAKALEYAHEHGVIHRDIKPANIMISRGGEVKISDFGIASIEGAEGFDSRDGLTGSVFYASPEQLGRKPLQPQSDIYSLGVVTYELLTGSRPFTADNVVTAIYRIINEEPAPIRTYRQDAPESLERIVFRSLEKDPEKRFKTGQHLATELLGSYGHLRFLEEEINFEKKFNAIKKLSFFKSFSSSELVEILKVTEWVQYDAAMTIISEGEVGEVFYIIVAGEVMVKKRGLTLAFLLPGDCFGEMAYWNKARRTASIKATRDTIVMKISSSFIDHTSTSTRLRFYKVFNQVLIQRLTRTSDLFTLQEKMR